MQQKNHNNAGQVLVILLIFIGITVVVTTAAVALIIVNSTMASSLEQSTTAHDIAESGAENGILRLLRDPTYTGETLTVGSGTATITVTGSNPQVITSTGKFNNFVRTIQVTVGYTGAALAVQSWTEIF